MSSITLPLDTVLDYVVGTLPDDLRLCVDDERSANPEFNSTVTELELGLAPLFLSGQPVAPSGDIWAAIEARLDEDVVSNKNITIDLKANGIWATTGVGVRTKVIWDGRSLLIECDPGATIPHHDHWAEERILVISGDVCFGDRCYGPGDTIAMVKGTHHGDTTTQTGCLFLLSYVN